MLRNLLSLSRPLVMAIVNVTDDSFYDASRTFDVEAIEHRVRSVVAEGADIIDIGGMSSRPGSQPISLEEEWQRVERALEVVRRVAPSMPISIDTYRSAIVRRAVERYGEVVVNDITAGDGDKAMAATVAELGLYYIIMHMRGTSQTMQELTDYDDLTSEVCRTLRDRAEALVAAGVARDHIILDAGFGFAKTLEQNYRLLGELDYLCALDYPVLVGLSRKSMIYRLLDIEPSEALAPTQAVHWEALRQGARLLRVHDVREAVQTVRMFQMFESQNRKTDDD